ncbi:MAG: glycosyltransferase [Eubacteriaceae bacterium]|nr:glycosyltransferase [Eubacteriaceae bacterium]
MGATISLCMIVKDEEKVLARCLSSIKGGVDEIIIVDTGSTDSTKRIAREFTDKVYDFEWIDDFSAARNYSFSLATMDYQMWLDADDVVEPEELSKMLALKESLGPEIELVTMRYHTSYDSQGKPVLTSTRERWLKRSKGYTWNDPIHEYIYMSGNILHSEIAISHRRPARPADRKDRNIAIYEKQLAQGKELSPRSQYYYARELFDHKRYEESIEYFNIFLDGGKGWFEDNIAACFTLSRCFNELGKKEKTLQVLTRSFEFDTPRAEICCQLGYYFKEKEKYAQAIYWFELALTLVKKSLGFVLNDYWDYIPNIELCLCYNSIGNTQKAYEHHKKSAIAKPGDPSVAFNEDYFKRVMGEAYEG